MGLKTLVGELGLSTQQLVRLMCNGVAARMDQPDFLVGLKDLVVEVGVPSKSRVLKLCSEHPISRSV